MYIEILIKRMKMERCELGLIQPNYSQIPLPSFSIGLISTPFVCFSRPRSHSKHFVYWFLLQCYWYTQVSLCTMLLVMSALYKI